MSLGGLGHHLLAGTAAGAVTSLLLHPLDLIKVRFQVQDGRSVPPSPTGGPAAPYRSYIQATAQIWRTEGARGFYRGVAPAAIGSGASWGLYFFFYENAKRRLSPPPATGSDRRQMLSAWQHMYAAWEGGTITCLFTNPIWLVKTRLQLQTGVHGVRDARNYRGMQDAFVSIVREEGLRGLYRGLTPALLLTSHGMIQFAVYEELKRRVPSTSSAGAVGGGSPAVFVVGAVSKAVATTMTYPYQVVKSRIQQRDLDGTRVYGRGFLAACRTIYDGEGLRGFYKGFVANLLRVAPQSAITLVTYEQGKRLLDGL